MSDNWTSYGESAVPVGTFIEITGAGYPIRDWTIFPRGQTGSSRRGKSVHCPIRGVASDKELGEGRIDLTGDLSGYHTYVGPEDSERSSWRVISPIELLAEVIDVHE